METEYTFKFGPISVVLAGEGKSLPREEFIAELSTPSTVPFVVGVHQVVKNTGSAYDIRTEGKHRKMDQLLNPAVFNRAFGGVDGVHSDVISLIYGSEVAGDVSERVKLLNSQEIPDYTEKKLVSRWDQAKHSPHVNRGEVMKAIDSIQECLLAYTLNRSDYGLTFNERAEAQVLIEGLNKLTPKIPSE